MAIAFALAQKRVVHDWGVIEGKRVRLIQDGNDLKYRIVDETARRVVEGIVCQNLSVEDMAAEIEDLKGSEVFLKDDGTPKFTRPYKIWNVGDDRELRLLRGPNDPVWQVYDQTLNTKTSCPAGLPGATYPSRRCGPHVFGEIQNRVYPPLGAPLFQERFSFLNEDVEPVTLEPGGNGAPFRVVVEPKTVKSQFNAQVLVSKLNWGVTLIRQGGGCDGGPVDKFLEAVARKLVNWHGQIIIEGIAIEDMNFIEPAIKKGKYFALLVHFDGDAKYGGKGSVEMKNLTGRALRYFERSAVSKTASYKVIRTLEAIQKEIRKAVPVPQLNLLGSSSILVKKGEESCYTWARGKLFDMGVTLISDKPKPDGSFRKNLISLTSKHTKPDEFYKEHPYYDDNQFL